MSVKQLSVFAENKNGSLFEITKILRDADIDISASSIADTQSYGVLRLIVCDPKKAAAALSAENKIVNVTEVVGVQIPDTKGGLNELLDVIASENISVDYLYAFVSSIAGKAYVVLRVENNELTEKLLKRYGFTLLTDEDIAG